MQMSKCMDMSCLISNAYTPESSHWVLGQSSLFMVCFKIHVSETSKLTLFLLTILIVFRSLSSKHISMVWISSNLRISC